MNDQPQGVVDGDESAATVLDRVADADLIDRLQNYKFQRAADLLRADHHPQVRNLVLALKAMFGNPGWFDGAMAVVIDAALDKILPDGEESQHE